MKKNIARIAIVLLILIVGSVLGYNIMNSRDFQVMGTIIPRVNTSEKVIALTFDDGPTEKTDEILKVLDEAGIKATFFVNGKQIEDYPEQTQQIILAGHEIGNHTYSHQRMIFKSPTFIKEELESTDRLIREAGYKGEIHFRPPNGKKLFLLPYYLGKKSKKTIMWDIEPDSYTELAADSEKMIEHINAEAKPGSIILLHVMFDHDERQSLEAIPEIVKTLSSEGYTFKTISELLTYNKDVMTK